MKHHPTKQDENLLLKIIPQENIKHTKKLSQKLEYKKKHRDHRQE